MGYVVDPNAASISLNGTIACFAASAMLGGVYARMALPAAPTLPIAAQYGLNGGFFGATLFHLREYACVPLLCAVFPGRARMYSPDFTPNWFEMRMRKVPETGLAGAAAAALNVFVAHKIARLPSLPTAMRNATLAGAVLCSFLAYVENETRVLRVKFSQESSPQPEKTPQERLDAMKNALGLLAPVRRGPEDDVKALEQLQREKQDANVRLEAVRRRLKDLDDSR
ncbi:hypothetical protein BKA62DRAFT_695352 [Auriculariales sp. MPI-PUGE-AT-0066]|nr:hypothetical protein BKA62DRAFT_695352 [Auriculariales sp. MPI-PUGE-AT-0066]